MTITLDSSSVTDYETFLRIKTFPQYRFVGRTAVFPDEYGSLLGIQPPALRSDAYLPIDGLFDYQRDITRLAIRKQKFATFVRPGLGKTLMQSEFLRHASEQIGGRKLLWISPLMVIDQTMSEMEKFYDGRLPVEQVSAAKLAEWLESPGGRRIGITNYESLRETLPQGQLGALVVDESSSLKSFNGKWSQTLIRLGKGLNWKMAATGTPAPNDRIEYANHAVFLDHFPTTNSFLSRFFVNRGQTQERWEMKPHALRPFYRALSHWSIFVNDPATYGWKDNVGALPPIRVHFDDVPMTDRQLELARRVSGRMYGHAGGITLRGTLSQIAKGSYKGESIETAKPKFIQRMVESWPGESTIIWCLYNAEQDLMEQMFPGAGSIHGQTKHEKRREIISDFKAGKIKTLISKPDCLGFGLNLQVATRHVFSGLQDSWETYFQCICRSNRIGSTLPLNVHIPLTEIERPMVETVFAKARRIEQDIREQEQLFKEMSQGAYGHVN